VGGVGVRGIFPISPKSAQERRGGPESEKACMKGADVASTNVPCQAPDEKNTTV